MRNILSLQPGGGNTFIHLYIGRRKQNAEQAGTK
jgi:hypothetical protein